MKEEYDALTRLQLRLPDQPNGFKALVHGKVHQAHEGYT